MLLLRLNSSIEPDCPPANSYYLRLPILVTGEAVSIVVLGFVDRALSFSVDSTSREYKLICFLSA